MQIKFASLSENIEFKIIRFEFQKGQYV